MNFTMYYELRLTLVRECPLINRSSVKEAADKIGWKLDVGGGSVAYISKILPLRSGGRGSHMELKTAIRSIQNNFGFEIIKSKISLVQFEETHKIKGGQNG